MVLDFVRRGDLEVKLRAKISVWLMVCDALGVEIAKWYFRSMAVCFQKPSYCSSRSINVGYINRGSLRCCLNLHQKISSYSLGLPVQIS